MAVQRIEIEHAPFSGFWLRFVHEDQDDRFEPARGAFKTRKHARKRAKWWAEEDLDEPVPIKDNT